MGRTGRPKPKKLPPPARRSAAPGKRSAAAKSATKGGCDRRTDLAFCRRAAAGVFTTLGARSLTGPELTKSYA